MLTDLPPTGPCVTPREGQSRLSLIVTTYNWPRALECCVHSVWRQTRLPDEIVIADDGSGAATGELVRHLAELSPVPLRHVWQEDRGSRAATIRNRAIAASTGDYIVFIDHDIVLHPRMLQDHAELARPGCFSQGKRAYLGRRLTARILAQGGLPPRIWPWQMEDRHHYTFRSPLLARHFPDVRQTPRGAMTANFAAWRGDIERVNGFNEDFVGWGSEDTDLVARMLNLGLHRQTLRFLATAYHLHHPRRVHTRPPANLDILRMTVECRLTRCANGLSKYSDTPAGVDAATG